MVDELIIRKAESKDLVHIFRLLFELGRPRPKSDKEADVFESIIKQHIADVGKEILVTQIGSKIVGVVILNLLTRVNRTTSELYIPELIVQEDYRNMGIGEKLITKCIEYAKKNNCYRLRLESGTDRKESHKFYKKIGFKQSALTFTLDIV